MKKRIQNIDWLLKFIEGEWAMGGDEIHRLKDEKCIQSATQHSVDTNHVSIDIYHIEDVSQN